MTATDHPLSIDGRGRTTRTDRAGYVRDLVEQVLFTAPGERAMRPDFGAGVMQLVFEPGGPELAGTTALLVRSALQQWLGDEIDVAAVDVRAEDGALIVTVGYTDRRTGAAARERFASPGGPS